MNAYWYVQISLHLRADCTVYTYNTFVFFVPHVEESPRDEDYAVQAIPLHSLAGLWCSQQRQRDAQVRQADSQ